MIKGLGIDIVENERIENKLNEHFLNMILNEKELNIYENLNKKLEFICGRFAAKEAIIKAISDFENPHMKEIIILNDKAGKPYVIYKNYNIMISISHEHRYTIAQAILL